ncbi:hypothetical protein AAHE18_16G192200 [Arachis hypogaea]
MMKYTLVLHGAEGSEGFTSLVSLNSRTVERGQGAEKQPKHQGAKTGALFINYTTKRRRMMAVLRVFLLVLGMVRVRVQGRNRASLVYLINKETWQLMT